jgi:hypothetical protein
MSDHQQADTETDHPAPGECPITLLAVCRLRASGYGALHGLGCTFESGVLHLRGCVPSYYLKQVAQSVVVDLEGVLQVNNQLEVFSQARDAVPVVKATEKGAARGLDGHPTGGSAAPRQVQPSNQSVFTTMESERRPGLGTRRPGTPTTTDPAQFTSEPNSLDRGR